VQSTASSSTAIQDCADGNTTGHFSTASGASSNAAKPKLPMVVTQSKGPGSE